MKKTLRVFVGVEIGPAVRRRAAELIAALRGTSANVKWVDPPLLHWTLKFLGEVPQRDAVGVCRAISGAVAGLAPFSLEVRGAGAFPTAARPRTVWLGAADGAEAMIALHDRVDAALEPLGFRREHRRFQPHLTIGRVRGDGPGILELGQMILQRAEFDAGGMTVQAATVFQSTLLPDGPIYEPLGTARLGGA